MGTRTQSTLTYIIQFNVHIGSHSRPPEAAEAERRGAAQAPGAKQVYVFLFVLPFYTCVVVY
jgi:hypothetical protein